MKAAPEIVSTIAVMIHSVYEAPQNAVRDVGELDAVLYTLHWLYADAVGQLDDFVRVRWTHFERDVCGFQAKLAKKESHISVDCRTDGWEFIDEWKRLDVELGIPVVQ